MSEPWDGECLSIPEAARACKIGEDTLRGWVKKGWLQPAYTPGIKQKKILRGTLLAFLSQNQDAENTPEQH